MLSAPDGPFAPARGVSLAGASLALTAYGIGSVTGRLAAGAVSDRLGASPTMGAACVIQTLALVSVWLPSREALLASLVALGVGFAASDTIIVRVVPAVFGVRAIGAILGALTLGCRVGPAVG